MRLLFAGLLLVSTTRAAESEPRCEIPTCMSEITAIGKGKQTFAAADGKTVVEVVDGQHMVLVRITRDKTVLEIKPAFVVTKDGKTSFIAYGADLTKPPLLAIEGVSWTAAKSATLEGQQTLAADAARTKKLDARRLFAAYRTEQRAHAVEAAKREIADTLAESVKAIDRVCTTHLVVTTDFTQLGSSALESGMGEGQHVCEDSFADYLATKCRTPAGANKVRNNIKAIRCTYRTGDDSDVKLVKGELRIVVNIRANREEQGAAAQEWWEKNF